jgi:hypothetical protein
LRNIYAEAGFRLPVNTFTGTRELADAILSAESDDSAHHEAHIDEVLAGCNIYAAYAAVFGRPSAIPYQLLEGSEEARTLFWKLHSDRELLLAHWAVHNAACLLGRRVAWCSADDPGRDYQFFLLSLGPRFVLKVLSFPAFMGEIVWTTLRDAVNKESPELQRILSHVNDSPETVVGLVDGHSVDEGWMEYGLGHEWERRMGEDSSIWDEECPWTIKRELPPPAEVDPSQAEAEPMLLNVRLERVGIISNVE